MIDLDAVTLVVCATRLLGVVIVATLVWWLDRQWRPILVAYLKAKAGAAGQHMQIPTPHPPTNLRVLKPEGWETEKDS